MTDPIDITINSDELRVLIYALSLIPTRNPRSEVADKLSTMLLEKADLNLVPIWEKRS